MPLLLILFLSHSWFFVLKCKTFTSPAHGIVLWSISIVFISSNNIFPCQCVMSFLKIFWARPILLLDKHRFLCKLFLYKLLLTFLFFSSGNRLKKTTNSERPRITHTLFKLFIFPPCYLTSFSFLFFFLLSFVSVQNNII